MGAHSEEPVARIGISRILEKVTAMEATLAVQACAIQAFAEDLKELKTSVTAMEADRFPWKIIGGIVGLATLAVAVIALLISTSDEPPPRPARSMSITI